MVPLRKSKKKDGIGNEGEDHGQQRALVQQLGCLENAFGGVGLSGDFLKAVGGIF